MRKRGRKSFRSAEMKLKEMLRPDRSSISPWPRKRPGNWRRRNSAKATVAWLSGGQKNGPTGLFQFELGDLDTGRADVTYAARRARLLPIEVAEPEPQAAVELTGNDLGNLAAVDDNTQPWRTLGDWADRLSRFERELPAAGPLVVDHLRLAVRTRRRRKTRWPWL